jgi:DDE superfamily endonuclease
MTRRLVGMLLGSLRSQHAKDVEIAVLRHQLSVLCRQRSRSAIHRSSASEPPSAKSQLGGCDRLSGTHRVSRRTINQSTKSIDGWYGTPAHGANPGFRAPQDGPCSVGVGRQYWGTLGKRANCQLGVSVNAITEHASCPLDWRLFVPEGWDDAAMATGARPATCRTACTTGPSGSWWWTAR